jgi:riboflavin kinase/FMN adenylyltransferase
VRTSVTGREVDGVANVGIRPTFDAGERTLEVHLLDFGEDIYGRTLRVSFVEGLRPEVRFPSLQEFLAQIQRDIARAREILGA